MEHIIQFGISIDDDCIRKKVEEQATHSVIRQISSNVENAVKEKWGYTRRDHWREIVADQANKFVEEHKGEIIDTAIGLIAEKMQKSKAYREACKTVVLARVSQLSDEDIVRLGIEAAHEAP